MSKFDIIKTSWLQSAQAIASDPWFMRLEKGALDLCHYKGYLRETYHHAGLNPQIQAFATLYFKDNPRDTIGMFFSHAKSEIGHDLLALQDLKNLGVNTDEIVASRPLPSTIALNAFVIYTIQFLNPIAYLGYLFHLEFLPTLNGKRYTENLKKLGVPETALTFLEEHSTVDIAHNKLMEKYVEQLVKTEKDIADVIYVAQSSCRLHQHMISDALVFGEANYR